MLVSEIEPQDMGDFDPYNVVYIGGNPEIEEAGELSDAAFETAFQRTVAKKNAEEAQAESRKLS